MYFKRLSIVVLLVLAAMLLAACSEREETARSVETAQQNAGTKAIVQNQPVPDLGGFSLERQHVIDLMLLRNQKVATWSYFISFDGKTIIEVCPSMGYPFPYSTQLTAPEARDEKYYSSTGAYDLALPQSEPNTLYSPDSADASWVLCVVNGESLPVYFEDKINTFPFQIESDRQLTPISAASISGLNESLQDAKVDLIPAETPEQ